jgi:hypothetical protein
MERAPDGEAFSSFRFQILNTGFPFFPGLLARFSGEPKISQKLV